MTKTYVKKVLKGIKNKINSSLLRAELIVTD